MMIDFVVKYTWTDRDGKTAWEYRVYHKRLDDFRRGMRRVYDFRHNLPNTVTDFVLNADRVVTDYPVGAQRKNLKCERFYKD